MSRKLAAVMAADIVGYSRLVGENETSALAALREFRTNAVRPFAAQHRGEIVKSLGDGWLVAFSSAQDAVSCAIKLQDAVEGHALIKLRIGVHIGDVTREEEDVFGDGVNIAARLEALAPTGGVALSDAAYAMLDGTLRPGFADQGKQSLKNIDRPVRVWMRAPVGASLSATAKPKLSGFPRLIVQPVATTDDRSEVRDLAEGLTADIALYLASVQWLETGEGYALTQTLRARGDRLRLEVRLTSPDGVPMWSGKYDGDLADGFDWQDEIGELVAGEVLGAILHTEGGKLAHLDEKDMSAEQLIFKGKISFVDHSEQSFANALHLLMLSIEKDRTLPSAYFDIFVHLMGARTLRYPSCAKYLEMVPDLVEGAKHLAAENASLGLVIAINEYLQEFDKVTLRREVERSLVRAPFDLDSVFFCGWSYVWMGDPLPALDCFATFRKLGRLNTNWNAGLGGAANASVQAGRFEEALEFVNEGLLRAPNYTTLHMVNASALAHLSRMEEAALAVQEILRIEPDASISKNRATSNYGGTPEGERYLEGLRLAGLPE